MVNRSQTSQKIFLYKYKKESILLVNFIAYGPSKTFIFNGVKPDSYTFLLYVCKYININYRLSIELSTLSSSSKSSYCTA